MRYKDFDQFYEVFKQVAALNRTPLSASDYVMYMQQRFVPGKDEQRVIGVEIMLNEPNSFASGDPFNPNGKLKNPSWTLKNVNTWDVSTVWQAYQGRENSPWTDYGNANHDSKTVTDIIRKSFHQLEDLINKGCDLLFSHQYFHCHTFFLNKAIPGRIIYQTTPKLETPYRS